MKLKATVFTAGFSVMVLEILGSRIIAPYFGNSLFVWTSLIGIVMGALSLGYWWGGRLSQDNPAFRRLCLVIAGAGLYTAVIPVLASRILPLGLVLGMKYGPLFSSIVILGVPSFLLGVVSPYSVKLATKSLKKVGHTAGNLYALSTVGSIIGTFSTGFVLIPSFKVDTILYMLGFLLVAISFLGIKKKVKE